MFRILALLLLPVICLAQVNSNGEKPTGELLSNEIAPNDMKRNASFNVEEIKVRWKKAALENCTGVPCVTTPVFTCGTSTVSDIDDNAYNTVVIGNQCWTQSNLKVRRYNDGTLIPDLTTSTSNPWATSGARSEYVISGVPYSGYVETYGYLYNRHAVADSRKLCPTGWHVPTDGEWTSLIQFIDPSASSAGLSTQSITAGGKLKSTTLWNAASPPSPGTDNYSFSALPGGMRANFGLCFSLTEQAYFWTSTEFLPGSPLIFLLSHNNIDVKKETSLGADYGYSVRCLKD
jgi:uncharacterized protein (TIGR02145 family)